MLLESTRRAATRLLIFPAPPCPNRSDNVHQSEQHRHLNQRTHGGGKGLITIRAERGDRNGDGKLKVVAGRREALGRGQFVAIPQLVHNEQREEENDGEIYDQWRSDPNDGNYLMNYLVSLRGEENQDCEEEADQ